MYLFIDNSIDGKVEFRYVLDTKIIHTVFDLPKDQSLLGMIDKIILDNGLSKKDLKGLAVIVGKGRFTSTRIAVTIVNTLAYSFGIPVLSVPYYEDKVFDLLKNHTVGQYISAEYSGFANIGNKK